MIPDTVLGLLVIAASLGPGYLFVRLGELRNPRPSRSTLLELVELVATGGTFTILVLWAALAVDRYVRNIVDLDALAASRTDYVLAQPLRTTTLVVFVIAGAYLLAWLAALAVYRGMPPTQRSWQTWHEAFRIQEHGGSLCRAYATVELRDGRTVAGPVAFYTTQGAPSDERELALERPISAKASGTAEYVEVPDERVILRASDIAVVSVQYYS